MELEVFLGDKLPNHNVDGALTKMVEEKMLVKATNKVGTEIYYLEHFAMQSLQRYNQFLESITICSDNGYRVRNKRQNTARTSISNKRQESSASKKSSVTPSAKKKARIDLKPSLSSSNKTKNLPKASLNNPSKIKTAH
jgi:hypothetical protein